MLKQLRLQVMLCLLVTALALMGCPDAGIDDLSDLTDPDPVDPATLPALPDSPDQVFLLVRQGSSGPVRAICAAAKVRWWQEIENEKKFFTPRERRGDGRNTAQRV